MAKRSRLYCGLLQAIACVCFSAVHANAQPLFRATAPLDITITTNLRELLRERDSTALEWHGAEFRYTDGDSVRVVPVRLRARGHFRRQTANCSFPPLFVRVAGRDARRTVLQGNPRLKIVTPCQPRDADYQQYTLTEYGVYRMYALLHDAHPRTRLARVTYEDSAHRAPSVSVTAFFVEIDDEVGKATGYRVLGGMKGATFDDVDAEAMASLALFAFMVGNPDWSVGALHNVYLLQDTTIGTIRPVGYDWDWTGIVNAKYAFPDKSLRIRSVTDRVYLGPCRTPEQWLPTFDAFRAQRAAIDDLWDGIPGLNKARRENIGRYLEAFWRTVDDPRAVQSQLVRPCRAVGN